MNTEISLVDHIKKINITEPSPVMQNLYKLSIEHQDIPISGILKMAGVTYPVYNNLCKNYMKLSDHRLLMLGKAFSISAKRREAMRGNKYHPKFKKENETVSNIKLVDETVSDTCL